MLSITAVSLVVGKVQAKGILLTDAQLFIGNVVVPTNEVNSVAKIVPVRPVITSAALIPILGGFLGL